jgi:hypothetical protein
VTSLTSGAHWRDPKPWAYSKNSTDDPDGPFGLPDRAATRVDGRMMFYPRPEFDNHNPILVVFRKDYENRLSWWDLDHFTETWLGPLGLDADDGDYPTYAEIWAVMQRATPEQLDHARRVLNKMRGVFL